VDELKTILNAMQRLSDEPITTESYARLLELFRQFLALAEREATVNSVNDRENDEED
jgi:hypothetical protein